MYKGKKWHGSVALMLSILCSLLVLLGCEIASNKAKESSVDKLKATVDTYPAKLNNYFCDYVIIGDELSRKNHKFTGEKLQIKSSFKGELAWRGTRNESLVCELKIGEESLDIPRLLYVRYNGDERPARGEKLLFDVLIDGKRIISQGLNRNFANSFIEEYYPIPVELLKGKTEVQVTFRPYDDKCSVGEIYNLAIVRAKTQFADFSNLSNYTGLDSKNSAKLPAKITYQEPLGPQCGAGGQFVRDNIIDLHNYYGLELTFDLQSKLGTTLKVTAATPVMAEGNVNTSQDSREIKFTLDKIGTQSLVIPFALFDNPKTDSAVLRNIQLITFEFEGEEGKVTFDKVRLLEGNSVKVETKVYGKAVESGKNVTYNLKLTNTDLVPQTISLEQIRKGHEAMMTEFSKNSVFLAPNESALIDVKVTIPEKIPAGGREKQLIQVVPSNKIEATQVIELVTAAKLSGPYTIHTPEGWAEVREKAKNYDWAKDSAANYIKAADDWKVAKRQVYMINGDTRRPCLVNAAEEMKWFNTAIAYQLTHKKEYAEKVREILMMISNPVDGYPVTRQVGPQSSVQEGHIFQRLAQAYDLIRDSGVLSEADVAQIENMLRLYVEDVAKWVSPQGANWAVSSQTGAFFCALTLQDFALVEHMLFGPSMLMEKFAAYTMSDGWWYECTVSYNLWCAEEYMQIALAAKPFGYNLLDMKFPTNYFGTPEYKRVAGSEQQQRRETYHGHSFLVRGGFSAPFVSIKMMSDALLPYLDYRGWVFGINDSTENNVGGGRFEIAYYVFRDPRYASFIKMAPKRDNLIYGVPELPAETPEPGKESAYSDNAGVLMLRSKQVNPSERIQAVLKYGTHGGYHGHFDRTALLSLQRYGRSFYNPEMIWYSYQPFMYNWYVQTSASKNMVTVDLKQQEAEDSYRRLFYTGDKLQAGCIENTSKWSYPAYGGLRWTQIGFPTFESKAKSENRFIPTPPNAPAYGEMVGFTEPVMQRRLMGVTDDYIVIADIAKGDEKHDFDQLWQIKGLKSISADKISEAKHSEQLTTDQLSPSQLVTDVKSYKVAGTVKTEFETKFGKDADNRGTRIYGEDGVLKMDVYNAWPNSERTVFTGYAPENLVGGRPLSWKITADGKVLKNGEFGAWVIGRDDFDIDLKDVKELKLITNVPGKRAAKNLFWGDLMLKTANGKVLNLHSLKPVKVENILANPNGIDKDYENGKINIAGRDVAFGLAAEPDKNEKEALYTYDLSGLGVVSLSGVIGADYRIGKEDERRITYGIRQNDTSARFLTVVEPYETDSKIASVVASSPDELSVTLKDGRVQNFKLKNFDGDGKNIQLEMSEVIDGKTVFTELAK